jgi:hypothetical protein
VTAARPATVDAAARAALARKYRALAELRARRDAGGSGAARAELRALAAEFPGCLRELDTLGGRELARRAAACAADATDAAAPEPWLPWIAAYHELMRAALDIRAGRAAAAGAHDPAFVAAVLRPPGGRLGVAVLRALAARFDTPAATIAAALFPVRRPSPYTL